MEIAHKDITYKPLAWQLLGLQYTASGYGTKIPTRWMVRHEGRQRRVYACCISNTETLYVLVKRWPVVVNLLREGE